MDVAALYERHRKDLLLFFVRRTADAELALDLWAETFAQAVVSAHRFQGATRAEEAGGLYAIARRQLALYYRRGTAEKRALAKLGIERPPADPEVEAELVREAGLSDLGRGA